MKIAHLEERIQEYQDSIMTVVDKRLLWNSTTKDLILKTFTDAVKQYDIGWKVQELSWIHSNEAINITFDSFPPSLIDCTNLLPAYQFLTGGALIFSQTYSGDIAIFMMFPNVDNLPQENGTLELGLFTPQQITEKLIVEKLDAFLKEIINWEVPALKKKLGF